MSLAALTNSCPYSGEDLRGRPVQQSLTCLGMGEPGDFAIAARLVFPQGRHSTKRPKGSEATIDYTK
jgi:hypothetical protein